MKKFNTNEYIKSYLYLHENIRNEDEAREIITELETLRPDWQNLRNLFFERTFPIVYIRYGCAKYYLKDYPGAIKILEEGSSELSHPDFKYFFTEKLQLYELLTKCYCSVGDDENAYRCALKVAYNEIVQINRKHYDNFEFYSFREVSEYSLNDLKNETISLCSMEKFNDPVDTAFIPWMHYMIESSTTEIDKKYLEILNMAYMNIRARCFVRNIPLPYKEGQDYPIQLPFQREFANTLMWSHYSKYHTGFCVKYILPSSFTITEPGQDELLMLAPLTYIERFPYEEGISFRDAFLTKQKLWEYEHEHRLLYFNVNGSLDYPCPQLPKGSIKAVYLGVRCSAEDRLAIYKSLRDRPSIEIYEMYIGADDFYKFKARPIDRDFFEKEIVE